MYVQSNTLLLADVLQNQYMCLAIYELDPACFLTAPGIKWEAALKITKVTLDLLTDIDMFLIVEKGVRRGTYHAIHWYKKANNKYMKGCNKNKESIYLKYWDVNNLC